VRGAGGSAFIQKAAGPVLWKVIAEQERLVGVRAEQLGIGEAVEGSALDAAVDRLIQLGRLPREVIEADTTLFRSERWPSDRFF
jgi:hypothetical protein